MNKGLCRKCESLTSQTGFKASWKQYLNLFYLRIYKLRQNMLTNVIPEGSTTGLLNLFYSTVDDGKKVFLKRLRFTLNHEKWYIFIVL